MTLENTARLADMRREHGLSQEELAERLGVDSQEIARWERAEASPDTDSLIALARLYNVTLDVLLGLQLPHTPDPAEKTAEKAASGYDPLPDGSYYEHQAQEAARAAEEAVREKARARERRRNRFPYPLVVTLAYLALGFCFHLWHPGWIIFLTIPLFYLPDRERRPLRLLGNPIMVTIIYLLLGTQCNWWHPGWLVFFLIPLLNAAER